MARITILMGLVIAIVFSSGIFLPGLAIEAVLASSGKVDVATRQQVLAATVQIVLLAPVLDGQGQPVIVTNGNGRQMQYQTGEGLGTLVRSSDELLVVTHDHWSLLSSQLAKARFYDADNVLLTELSGIEFLNLIRSRDNGTLVLAAPAGLLGNGQLMAAEIGNSRAAGWGTVVAVVYREPETGTLEVKLMAISSTADYQGSASYVLRSTEGTVVIAGNSGGGIWHNGKLVGNMWTTIMAKNLEDGRVESLNMSRAAQLNVMD